LKILCWGVAVVLVSGCAINIRMPVNHFDTSESIGESSRLKLDVAYVGASDVVLTEDFVTSAPNPSHPDAIDSAYFLRFGGGVSLLDNLDLELKSLTSLQAKYQLLGQPRSRAHQGNFSLAAMVLASFDKQQSSSLQNTSPNANYSSYDLPMEVKFSVGYRILKPVLLYATPFYQVAPFWGTYQGANLIHYSGTATAFGGNLGIEVGIPEVQLIAEAGWGQTQCGDFRKDHLFVSGQIAFNFGGDKVEQKKPKVPTRRKTQLNSEFDKKASPTSNKTLPQ
jgi:hypothetical protein